MVHESGKAILHLGLIKSEDRKNVYHCNSFMTTYQTDREKNLFFCNLSKRYEINKIIREDKKTKKKDVIYLSEQAELREKSGIIKMLEAAGIYADEELLMLSDEKLLMNKCKNKRDEVLVKEFLNIWKK